MKQVKNYLRACPDCCGEGKKTARLSKKMRMKLKAEFKADEPSEAVGTSTQNTLKLPSNRYPCAVCNGTGLVKSEAPMPLNDAYPHLAIIGAGIGGVALALACLHRGIPFTLYERDKGFNARSQGYGLTLQQASKTIKALGIHPLKDGLVSSKHIVHNSDGKIIGEWGMRKWMSEAEQIKRKKTSKRTNMHIARQSLRLALLEQLGGVDQVKWSWQLKTHKQNADQSIEMAFEVDGRQQIAQADLIVGADGIRSVLRSSLIGDHHFPLRYLGVMVVLGICPLHALAKLDSHLLDSATVFQTANGHERIYVMPFSKDEVMWQLSFPLPESEAKTLAEKGQAALKQEAIQRTQWHSPVPNIVAATPEVQITGYPVYDRALLPPDGLQQAGACTLIGDAAHPMSPFKGQGANQALIDALSLARLIAKLGKSNTPWQESGLRETVLNNFEAEMLERSASKVKGSADAVAYLHSETVLQEANEPRGRRPSV